MNKVEHLLIINASPRRKGNLSRMLEAMREVEGESIRPAQVSFIAQTGEDRYQLELTIHEGRNRQVRRMLEACGRETRRLKRVAVGGLRLGGLPPGAWRFLSTDEVRLALGDPSGSHL